MLNYTMGVGKCNSDCGKQQDKDQVSSTNKLQGKKKKDGEETYSLKDINQSHCLHLI